MQWTIKNKEFYLSYVRGENWFGSIQCPVWKSTCCLAQSDSVSHLLDSPGSACSVQNPLVLTIQVAQPRCSTSSHSTNLVAWLVVWTGFMRATNLCFLVILDLTHCKPRSWLCVLNKIRKSTRTSINERVSMMPAVLSRWENPRQYESENVDGNTHLVSDALV